MRQDRTTIYAKSVVSGKKIAGRKEFLACKRHLDDLKERNLNSNLMLKRQNLLSILQILLL